MNPATLQAARDLGVNAMHDKPANFQDIVKLTRHLYDNWSAKED